jgi:hypothetical protein
MIKDQDQAQERAYGVNHSSLVTERHRAMRDEMQDESRFPGRGTTKSDEEMRGRMHFCKNVNRGLRRVIDRWARSDEFM